MRLLIAAGLLYLVAVTGVLAAPTVPTDIEQPGNAAYRGGQSGDAGQVR
jgi:hypothetical protein